MGASGGDDSHCRNRRSNRKIDRNSSSINHKALETFPMATTRPSYTKLTCPSPTTTTGARGLPRFHNRRRGANVHTRRVRFVRSQLAKPNEKAHLVPFHTPTSSQPEGPTTSLLQPILIDDNGTPATWTLVLFQQAIDRQDRTLQSRRTLQLLLEPLEIQPVPQEYSHYRTRTHRSCDDMPCRTTLH